jgi:hypothetical protein
MTKPKPDITDPRTLAIESLKRLGGIEGFVNWGKTHRTLYYNLYAKLMAQPVVTNFTTIKNNVNIDGEAARRQLETAFLSAIQARKASVCDPAVFIDGERLIEHRPATGDPPPLDDVETSRDGISHTRDGRPVTDDPRPATDDSGEDNPRLAYRREAAARQREAADARRAALGPAPSAVVTPSQVNIAAEPSTTAKYLEWSASRRHDKWGNHN